jgi:hypothetical protein
MHVRAAQRFARVRRDPVALTPGDGETELRRMQLQSAGETTATPDCDVPARKRMFGVTTIIMKLYL